MVLDYNSFLKNFHNAFYCTISTKLRDFHYRVMTNSLVTSRKLYQWKIKATNECTFCNIHAERIIHPLCECSCVQSFGNKFFSLSKATFS